MKHLFCGVEKMDRQTAADLLDNLIGMVDDSQGNDYDTAFKMGIEALKADVQPVRHGVWMEENRRPRSAMFYCSECHRTAYDIQPTRDKTWEKRCRYAYCPNCGARMLKYTGMDGEQNDIR